MEAEVQKINEINSEEDKESAPSRVKSPDLPTEERPKIQTELEEMRNSALNSIYSVSLKSSDASVQEPTHSD